MVISSFKRYLLASSHDSGVLTVEESLKIEIRREPKDGLESFNEYHPVLKMFFSRPMFQMLQS